MRRSKRGMRLRGWAMASERVERWAGGLRRLLHVNQWDDTLDLAPVVALVAAVEEYNQLRNDKGFMHRTTCDWYHEHVLPALRKVLGECVADVAQNERDGSCANCGAPSGTHNRRCEVNP